MKILLFIIFHFGEGEDFIMKKSEIELINKLLIGREYLISDYLYERSFQEVKAILEMEELKDDKYKGLLTSNIWHSNLKDIKKILEMKEWKPAL